MKNSSTKKIKKILNIDSSGKARIIETEKEKEVEKEKTRFFQSVSLAGELGFSIAIPVAGGAILGSFLDKKFATSPKFTLSLIFFGLILSLCTMYQTLKRNTQ